MKPRIESLVSRLSPPERDRLMQVHLAQARGTVRNGDLLRRSIDWSLRIKAAREPDNGGHGTDDALINTLTEVTAMLDSLGVSHAVSGSVASSVHGEPLTTLDVHLLVQADTRRSRNLVLWQRSIDGLGGPWLLAVGDTNGRRSRVRHL